MPIEAARQAEGHVERLLAGRNLLTSHGGEAYPGLLVWRGPGWDRATLARSGLPHALVEWRIERA